MTPCVIVCAVTRLNRPARLLGCDCCFRTRRMMPRTFVCGCHQCLWRWMGCVSVVHASPSFVCAGGGGLDALCSDGAHGSSRGRGGGAWMHSWRAYVLAEVCVVVGLVGRVGQHGRSRAPHVPAGRSSCQGACGVCSCTPECELLHTCQHCLHPNDVVALFCSTSLSLW